MEKFREVETSMAHFLKHLKKHAAETTAAMKKTFNAKQDHWSSLVGGLGALLGGLCGIAAMGAAIYFAPVLATAGFFAAGVAGVAIGHAKNPGNDGKAFGLGFGLPVVAGGVAGAFAALGVVAAPVAFTRYGLALVKAGVDAAIGTPLPPEPDKAVLTVKVQEPAALPAPVANEFNLNTLPKPEAREEVLRVTVERMNDKIRKI